MRAGERQGVASVSAVVVSHDGYRRSQDAGVIFGPKTCR